MMGGKKTWIAVIAAFATGLGIIFTALGSAGPDMFPTIIKGVLVVIGGVALLGLGHKVEKVAEIIKGILEGMLKEK